MTRLAPLSLVAAALLPLGSCCSLSRFFCGPDRTPWVSVEFDSPAKAVKTLLEAIRRDEPEVVYLCLSTDYRRRLGLDAATVQLAWQRIREANPGLHVVGYAEVPAPKLHGPEHASMSLDVEGRQVDIHLVRQSYWELRYQRTAAMMGQESDGPPGEGGEPIGSFAGFARIETMGDAERSRISIGPLTFYHDGITAVPLDALDHVALTRRWKVADLQVRAP